MAVMLASKKTLRFTTRPIARKHSRQAIEEHNIDLFKYAESQILTKISDLKNQLITYEDFEPRPGAPLDAIVQKLYPLYQKRLIRSNAVDFDDLLLHVAKLLSGNPDVREDLDARYEYISVDEYQDTNYAQYMILKMLSVNHRNLAVTGDPDQSIYGWAWREHPQYSRFRKRLSGDQGRQAGAKLPEHAADSTGS